MWAVILGFGLVDLALWWSKYQARDVNWWFMVPVGLVMVWVSGYSKAQDRK